LPSARSRALSKARLHSAGISFFLSHSLTLSQSRRRHRRSPPRHRRARARPRRARSRSPTPSPRGRSRRSRDRAVRRAPVVSPSCLPSSCPHRVPAMRALIVPSPCPCRAPAASPRDPPTRPRPVDSSATRRPARWV
jgi:hypothetical protein